MRTKLTMPLYVDGVNDNMSADNGVNDNSRQFGTVVSAVEREAGFS